MVDTRRDWRVLSERDGWTNRVAAPASFTMLESINMVLIVIIGGAGSLAGPALGALLYVALPELLRLSNEWRLVIFGVMLVLITLFAPKGLAGLCARAWSRLWPIRSDTPASAKS
jgi:branched-chain amino acid transport system permease protein